MVKTEEITNSQDYIDSREIIARIEELENATVNFGQVEELQHLKALTEEAEGYYVRIGYPSEWSYGVTLIREDCFEDYARELAEDIGAISKDTSWPATCIDWEQAANELKMDYTEVDFNGVSYYVR